MKVNCRKISKVALLIILTIFMFLLTLIQFGTEIYYSKLEFYNFAGIALYCLFYGSLVYFMIKNNISKKLSRIILGFILLGNFLIRLYFVMYVYVTPKSDFGFYYSLAETLRDGASIEGSKYIASFPHVIGLPKILSSVFLIFGTSIKTVGMMNIFLSIGIAFLLYLIGKEAGSVKTGLLVSIVWSFWPSQILYTLLVCTELIYSFCTLLIIYLYIKYALKVYKFKQLIFYNKNFNIIYNFFIFALLGVLIAYINSIRSVGIIVLLAICIHYIVIHKNITKYNILFKIVSILILVTIFSSVSSLISNKIQRDLKINIASNPIGFNLYVGVNTESKGLWNSSDSELFHELTTKNIDNIQTAHDVLIHKSVERIKNLSIREFLILMVNKFVLMWSTDNEIVSIIEYGQDDSRTVFKNIKENPNVYRVLSQNYYSINTMLIFIVLVYVLIKFIKYRYLKVSDITFLIMIINIGIIILHQIVEVQPRYHFFAIPLFSIYLGTIVFDNLEGIFGGKKVVSIFK